MSDEIELKSPVKFNINEKRSSAKFGIGFSNHEELIIKNNGNRGGGGTIVLCCSCGGGSANVSNKSGLGSD